ncbi:MAG: hypothetical protein ACI4TI_02135 [Christensenellales bacterium]
MSFFSNNRTDNRCPGPITGNPLNGLCERVCIQTNKVFDSCRKQISETGLTFTLTNITPAGLVEPFTFVSAQTNGDAFFSDLVIDRFPDRPNFARVTGTVNVPIIVNFTDANGTEGSGTTNLTFNQDVILFVPQPSVVPFTIDVFAGVAIADATFLGDNTFSADACVQIILRVVVNTNILVPSYGYCPIPPCQDFSTNDVCPGFFDLPIYPA